MDDIELGVMDVDAAKSQLMLHGQISAPDVVEERVETAFGPVIVGISGNKSKPAFVTFHDLGLNANSCFQSFFEFSEMVDLMEKFCVYHINAPGQHEDARPLPENYIYPTMDDLAGIVLSVVDNFQIKHFIGFGVGAGANVMLRFAMKHESRVDALILVNATAMACGWIEWGYQQVNMNYLKKRGMTAFTLDYLLWHHFGKRIDECNPDLVYCYKQYFARLSNPINLAMFIQTYIGRNALDISREGAMLDLPVMQLVGQWSPFVEESVDLNSKLDPTKSDWVKLSDCSGLVLEETPDKVTEAVLLFLQGLGHFPSLSHAMWKKNRTKSHEETPALAKENDSSPESETKAEIEHAPVAV